MADIMIAGKAGRLSVRTKGMESKSAHVVVLVQGANLTGQLGFDFTFPGSTDYSVMDALVARGYGALTFSIRGYGKSDKPADPLTVDTDAAIEDLIAVIEWLRPQGYAKPHLVGWSWGGRIAGRFAEEHGSQVARLVLLDPALGGGNRIPFTDPQPWWSNTYEYFMNRLESEFTEAHAKEALARQASTTELHSPNGIRAENARGSIRVDATRINNPTLMLYGQGAGKQNYMQGGVSRTEFFDALPLNDKALVIIPNGGDYAHLQDGRLTAQKVIGDFLSG